MMLMVKMIVEGDTVTVTLEFTAEQEKFTYWSNGKESIQLLSQEPDNYDNPQPVQDLI